MELKHHGGHDGVTGSCHQLTWESGDSLLVDCGLFQGDDARRHPDLEIDFSLDDIQALFLTHVHIDHVGRLPYLFAAGFAGPIYCTHPTAKLLPLVIEDALKIGFTRNERLIKAFQDRVSARLRPLDYGRWDEVLPGIRARLTPAGHILGSCYIEFDGEGKRVVFSGDLGAPHAPLLTDPKPPERADLLVLESTYGDQCHQGREQRQATLESVLRKTLDDKGVTIIPAFSLGRTQELLYEMNGIFEKLHRQEGRSILKAVDVIVDSPLAARYTDIYQDLQPFWDAEAQQLLRLDDQPLVFENLTTIGDHDEHLSTMDYIERAELPAIILAGSGMCTGGRVVNYLQRFLGQPNADVVFVGYQGRGTPGRELQRGSRQVELAGQTLDVRASIHTISGYSAHADQRDLLNFATKMAEPPAEVVLVHGEEEAKRSLQHKLAEVGIESRDANS